MPYRQLVTIPLSHGVSGNTWHLSVALMPRLHEDGVLSDYSDDWARWPDLVNGAAAGGPLRFNVIADGRTLPAGAISVVSPAPDQAMWRAIFGSPVTGNQPVERYRFVDRRAPDLATLESGELAEGLSALFLAIAAAHPDEPPTVEAVRALDTTGILAGSSLGQVEEYIEATGPRVENPKPPTVEFHQAINLLRAHPYLLRLLGLVVDFEITLGATMPGRVRVETNWPGLVGLGMRDQCPLTLLMDTDLWPRTIDEDEHVDTFLPLADRSRFAMTTHDVIGGAVQLLGYSEASDTGAQIDPPTPAEAGVAVIHRELGQVLVDRFTRQRELEDQIDEWFTTGTLVRPPVYLEDVMLGYRYDVYDFDDPTWRSLFERRTVDGYHFPRRAAADLDAEDVPQDEGVWSLALMTESGVVRKPRTTTVRYPQEGKPSIEKAEESDDTSWRVPDVTFRWNGWSAAVPNPGSSLNGDGTVSPRMKNESPSDQAAKFETRYGPVPGTLPRLRYTRTYQFRARATDLAGVSKDVAAKEPSRAKSVPVTFRRTQPVAAPTVVRRRPKPVPGVGDTQLTMVIKSELGDRPFEIASTNRHLFPPRISQPRLEFHGLPVDGIDPGSYAFLVERDAKSIGDMTDLDLVGGELVSDSAEARPAAVYLVDPTAAGVCLSGAPGLDKDVVAPYGGSWPDPTVLNVELRAGDYRTRVLGPDKEYSAIFFMPQGREQVVELSHAIDTDFLNHFEAFGAQPGHVKSAIRRAVRLGRHSSISSRTDLTLVHAVRLPLAPALFSGAAITVGREAGNQRGRVSGGITLDRPSTDMVRLIGAWTDPVDDLSLPEPTTRSYTADTTITIPSAGAESTAVLDNATLDLVDTRRHTVTLSMDAFSRFRRYFTEQAEIVVSAADPTEPVVLDGRGVAAQTVTVDAADGRRLTRNDDFVIDGEAGTLTRVASGSLALDEVHTVRFIPRPIFRSSTDEELGQTVVTFPSAVRPSPPELIDVVPAALRSIDERADRIAVDHDGRVLRLRLARPWWSSGEGEQLGVVVDPFAVDVSDLTAWGRDPIIDAGTDLAAPSVADFPLRDSETSVDDLAAHDVRFNTELGAWEVDVLVAAPTERPFVRLACARHQPESVDGLDRSGVVHTQPTRLGPRRTVIAKQTETAGAVFCAVDHGPLGRTVRVVIQTADANIADPDLRWSDVVDGGERAVAELDENTLDDGTNRYRNTIDVPGGIVGDVRFLYEELDGDVVVYSETIEIPPSWL